MEKDTSGLIKMLNEWDSEHQNGAILLHYDKISGVLKSISPVIPTDNLRDMIDKLIHARNAIDGFIKQLVDSQLSKN